MFTRHIFVILAVSLAPICAAQTAPDPADLSKVTAEKAKAEAEKAKLDKERAAAEAEIKRLRAGLIDAAAEAQSYERAARTVAQKLTDLEREASKIEAAMKSDRAAMADLLAVLQRLERNPPPAIAVMPEDAAKAARAAKLMSTVTHNLSERSEALRIKLQTLNALQAEISNKKRVLTENEREISKRRAAISKDVGVKTALEARIRKRSAEQEARIAKLTADAKSLQDLITKFEQRARSAAPRVKPLKPGNNRLRGQEGKVPVPRLKPRADRPPEPYIPPPDTARFADARGAIRAPVQGRITRKYKARNADGSRESGYTVSTRAGAQVVAPYSGRIAFSGPFKTHGNVFMLDVGDNYFIVLTGLSKAYGGEGDRVSSGEPIGVMGGGASESLYIEFWKNGSPIDPGPWLGTAFARAG